MFIYTNEDLYMLITLQLPQICHSSYIKSYRQICFALTAHFLITVCLSKCLLSKISDFLEGERCCEITPFTCCIYVYSCSILYMYNILYLLLRIAINSHSLFICAPYLFILLFSHFIIDYSLFQVYFFTRLLRMSNILV